VPPVHKDWAPGVRAGSLGSMRVSRAGSELGVPRRLRRGTPMVSSDSVGGYGVNGRGMPERFHSTLKLAPLSALTSSVEMKPGWLCGSMLTMSIG
jgi:hypothetical protein